MFHVAALVSAFLDPRVSICPLSRDATDTLWVRCQHSRDEFSDLFTSVYERLHCVQQTLQGCGRNGVRRTAVVLVLFTRIVARFHAAVAKHRELNLLVRFATKRSTLEKLRELHGAIDQLFRYLEVQNHEEMAKWSEEWPQQCNRMYALFTSRVEKPQLAIQSVPKPQVVEILAIMLFELLHHKDEPTPAQAALLRDTYTTLLRSSKVKVPKVPVFYIPSIDVDFGFPHESIEDTHWDCVVTRGVCDQATRLVVQYLSADERYSQQLFLRATEIWHGFQHPHVMRMVGGSHVGAEHFVVWEDVAAQGNFIHYFTNSHGDTERHRRRLWRMFLQVARGLHYIHAQGQTHGSLKCSQILVNEDETPKICQFELNEDSRAFDRWKSPEAYLDADVKPSKAGDVYAFGLCVIEAFTGAIPYDILCEEEVVMQLEEGKCYPRPEGMRDDEWDVLERFVAHNPKDRPTMDQAIEMVEGLAWRETKEEAHADSAKMMARDA